MCLPSTDGTVTDIFAKYDVARINNLGDGLRTAPSRRRRRRAAEPAIASYLGAWLTERHIAHGPGQACEEVIDRCTGPRAVDLATARPDA